MFNITFSPQRDQMDCGPACLSMVASTYGKRYPVEYLRDECFITLSEEKFRESWLSDNEKGIALFLNPTENFYKLHPTVQKKITLRHLYAYLKSYRWQLFFMFVLLLLGSVLTLFFPFYLREYENRNSWFPETGMEFANIQPFDWFAFDVAFHDWLQPQHEQQHPISNLY
jgi:ABC-type bacteriocin/lantibiotic exporter with double-glycine peptidase domain